MYEFNIGTTATNAFIIYRELVRSSSNDPKLKRITQGDFRQQLFKDITERFGQDTVHKWVVNIPPTEQPDAQNMCEPVDTHVLIPKKDRKQYIVYSRPYQRDILGKKAAKIATIKTRWECQHCLKRFCNKEYTGRDCFSIGHRCI